jgi:hypothetical protein
MESSLEHPYSVTFQKGPACLGALIVRRQSEVHSAHAAGVRHRGRLLCRQFSNHRLVVISRPAIEAAPCNAARLRHLWSRFPVNEILRPGTSAKTALQRHLRRLRDQARAHKPPNSGLFTRLQEFSAKPGLPGGPERTTCQPRSHIELVSEKARTAKLVGLEPVSGSTT